MAYEAVNVGNAADDHTGDPLRTAFQKINENFAGVLDDIVGLGPAADAAVAAHVAAVDPHTQYALESALGTLASQNGTFSGTHSGASSGTNTGDQTNISGNAATVTTNANLTGHVTSTGNAAVLGSFTVAQLNAALSDGDVATGGGTATGANTGDQTNISGNAATVTTNANLTGHVTSTGNAAVLGSFTVAQLNAAVSDGDVATGGGTASGSNTGDNATNSQYSGLAASKQDTLVSGTNIKTVNGSTLLGSGDLTVSADDLSTVLTTTSTVGANKQRVLSQLSINDGGGILVITDTAIVAMV